MSKNPFTPTDPIARPEDFVGRHEQLRTAVDALINGTNVVITGYRGIGKTSLAAQVLAIVREPIPFVAGTQSPGQTTARPLAGVHTCSASNDLADIAQGLLASLRRTRSGLSPLSVKGELNVGFLKGMVEFKDSTTKPTSVTATFIDGVCDFMRQHGGANQYIYFFIDEIETLVDGVTLGAFIKVAKENLRAEGVDRVAFLLVGQTGITYKLIRDHPSVGRTLTFIDLPRMQTQDIEQLFDRASAKSGITFDPGIVSEIARLAHGFPSVAQLIGYQCCFVDKDQYIDVLDFEAALTLAAAKLHAERYVAYVHDIDDHQLALQILDALCEEPAEVVNTGRLLAAMNQNATPEQFAMELTFLEESDLIERVDIHAVRLRDRLIAIYYFLRSTRQRSSKLIQSVVSALTLQGFSCRVCTPSHNRLVDAIARKTKSYFVFFSRSVNIGVICLPSYDVVPESLISSVRDQYGRLLLDNALDFLVAVSERSMLDTKAVEAFESIDVRCLSLEQLAHMRLENY